MDRTKLFPIGEVSKLFHISVSSLRHYENIGLLTPEYVSPDSGYRATGITVPDSSRRSTPYATCVRSTCRFRKLRIFLKTVTSD